MMNRRKIEGMIARFERIYSLVVPEDAEIANANTVPNEMVDTFRRGVIQTICEEAIRDLDDALDEIENEVPPQRPKGRYMGVAGGYDEV